MQEATFFPLPHLASVRLSLLPLGRDLLKGGHGSLTLLGEEYWIPPAEEALGPALLPVTQGLTAGDSFRPTPGEHGLAKNAVWGSDDRLRRQMPGSYPSSAT